MPFPQELLTSLDVVLARCKGANAHLTPATPAHADDVEDVLAVQAALATIGVTFVYGEAHNLWELVSLDNQENWSFCPRLPEEVLISVEILCRHVADRCDYAGISRPAN